MPMIAIAITINNSTKVNARGVRFMRLLLTFAIVDRLEIICLATSRYHVVAGACNTSYFIFPRVFVRATDGRRCASICASGVFILSPLSVGKRRGGRRADRRADHGCAAVPARGYWREWRNDAINDSIATDTGRSDRTSKRCAYTVADHSRNSQS